MPPRRKSNESDSPPTSLNEIFVGDGEMAHLMRARDWSQTSLGDPHHWPHALKVAVRLLLTSRFEMWLGWGPDIAFLYNDAYRPTLGNKHPRALGMPTEELWAEIWSDIAPRLRRVYQHGEATWDRALLLILRRSGYPEETYHTFSYSPLIGDSGGVEGVFCAVTEETDRVISERRLASLKALASGLSVAGSEAGVFAAAAAAAREEDRDMPFCAAYGLDDAGDPYPLFGAVGEDPSAGLVEAAHHWPVKALQAGEDLLVIDIPESLQVACGAWHERPRKAALVALGRQGGVKPAGALVVGLNPFRPFDDDYRSYLNLFAGQIAASWANASAFDLERRRAAALAEALDMRQKAAETLRQANERLSGEVKQRTQERNRLQALFKQAPSFMALLSGPQHVFELANDAYMQLVGHRPLIGLTVREAIPEVEGQGYFELLDKVYATGEAYLGRAVKVRLQRSPDAPLEERFVNLVYQPISIDGAVSGIFVDGYDVTHQKLAEDALRQLNNTLESRVEERTRELEEAMIRLQHEAAERARAERALQKVQKMEALGALTGGVAHDFNNLLQVISGNLQLLSRAVAGNPMAMQRVENALNGVARGAKLASQLLAFGRRQPLEPKVVNVGKFIRGMEDMLRRALGEGIEIETVISGGLWNTLIDPGQIENALLNLAINARDAMDGHGRLTIEAGNALLDEAYCLRHDDIRPGQYVMVAVTDTGCGIPADLLERVFEPFFSTKPEGKGTGLGLSMVYGFVKQSGGHIMIYSEVGEGTTVKLYLPRSLQPEDVMPPAATGPVNGGTETILVVEDDEDVRETAVAILSDLGYRVLKAKDADSALTVIDSGIEIDLLFTDVVMPGNLRSPELARKALQRLPGLGVLFTSGYTENSIVHGGRLDAGVELLTKPYTREALARRVRHILSNQAQRRLSRAVADARTLSSASSSGSAPEMQQPWQILLVEDDELIRSATRTVLEERGHRVVDAASGAEALNLLGARHFDVAVIDLGLPDMPGLALARRARERDPQLALVFATGSQLGPAEVPEGSEIVKKPYDVEAIVAACRTVLLPARR